VEVEVNYILSFLLSNSTLTPSTLFLFVSSLLIDIASCEEINWKCTNSLPFLQAALRNTRREQRKSGRTIVGDYVEEMGKERRREERKFVKGRL
jgi:hypothetical protein